MEEKQLLRFLHLKKTELSCMENPLTFVCQLRDYNLIPEEQYKKINRMKSKERLRSAMYTVLDRIEKEKPKHIERFWRCAFKETILNMYPTLRLLRNSLYDGSFESESALLEGVENEEEDRKRKELSDEEEQLGETLTKKKKPLRLIYNDDEEQPGPSSQVTPATKKKNKKLCFTSPLKKGEKGEIWTWAIYKVQLPVTCGDHEGALNRGRLAKGDKCILVNKQWYTPSQFERLAGKANSRNWKLSIRCMGTPLAKLIQEGHLKCTSFKRHSKAKKSLFPSEETTTVSETEDASSTGEGSSDSPDEQEDDSEEQHKQQSEAIKDSRNRVLSVTCKDLTGLLHTKRFASGTCGKSIRTDTGWVTPVDFVKDASCQTDVSWKKHIKCEGKPLGDLINAKMLEIHSLLCTCSLCVPTNDDLDNEKNDDECWICRSDEVEEGTTLVECDECPCSFHQKCHLPHIEDALLDDDRPWICTLCVFRQSLNLYPEREIQVAMASATSAHMLHCQYLLLGLYRDDEEQLFTTNPCHCLSDYRRVINTPMWLDHIANKFQENKYQTVGEFVSDVRLIFTNCATYNRDNPYFRAIGEKMEGTFERELKSVFKVREVTLNS